MSQNQSFENLVVFQKAYKASLALHKKSLGFPKIEQCALADQIRRSSKSVCANIAEGYARRGSSVKEFQRFLFIAIGSSDETRVWLRYAMDLGYITEHEWTLWKKDYIDISKMLNGLRRKAASSSDP